MPPRRNPCFCPVSLSSYVFDAESLYFLQVSRGARENLGYSDDELAEMTPVDLKPEFDRQQFETIIRPLNLLSNAIKFTESGGRVTLKTWCDPSHSHVFQVADTGIGVAPDDIPKALEQFGQIDSSLARKSDGTGLGLPLTKALVEAHGGSFELTSEVGVGTIVTVSFPPERTRLAETEPHLTATGT